MMIVGGCAGVVSHSHFEEVSRGLLLQHKVVALGSAHGHVAGGALARREKGSTCVVQFSHGQDMSKSSHPNETRATSQWRRHEQTRDM